jgi:fused signal recognition particle receptor
MQAEWIEPLVWAVVGVALVGFFAGALRRARRRRREELSEDAVPRVRPAPEPEHVAQPPEDETEGGPLSEAEPDFEAEAEAEPEPEPEPEPTVAPVVDAALERGLEKTSSSFLSRLNQVFGRHASVGPEVLDELEEVLLTSDVGVRLTAKLIDDLRARLQAHALGSADAVRQALEASLLDALGGTTASDPLSLGKARPHVILFVGVNGVGKTTTIGKVAALLRERGRSVVLAAGDTFRAAAVEQLEIWGKRTDCRVIRGEARADPASVIFNAVEHAATSAVDVVLADTAGRLHTKTALMDEIKKVKRAAAKARDGAPDETWLVVDATTGQNALQQAREFDQALGLSGVILTKLDGTAKGGVVIAIAESLGLPVRFVGVGERPEDLRPFEARSFVNALFARR